MLEREQVSRGGGEGARGRGRTLCHDRRLSSALVNDLWWGRHSRSSSKYGAGCGRRQRARGDAGSSAKLRARSLFLRTPWERSRDGLTLSESLPLDSKGSLTTPPRVKLRGKSCTVTAGCSDAACTSRLLPSARLASDQPWQHSSQQHRQSPSPPQRKGSLSSSSSALLGSTTTRRRSTTSGSRIPTAHGLARSAGRRRSS